MAVENDCCKWRTYVSKSVKNSQKKNAFFWPLWVPSPSMEGVICVEANLGDEKKLLMIVSRVLHPITGLSNLFLGPKYRKIILKCHLPVLRLTAMDWAPLR